MVGKGKNLSWMGQATLIKSVALSTPLYAMLAFKFPKKLNEEMDAMIQKFWWNPRAKSNRVFTPLAWKNLCRPLSEGGLGFKSFESFNEAMITKLAWWVLSKRDSLCVKVLRAKYKVSSNWISSRNSKSASISWRGVESVKPLLATGACKVVGSRGNTLVWEDNWVPDLPDLKPKPRIASKHPPSLVVANLLSFDGSGWDEGKLRELFDDESIRGILNIPKRKPSQADHWTWFKSTSGEFSVKSAYKEIINSRPNNYCNPILSKI